MSELRANGSYRPLPIVATIRRSYELVWLHHMLLLRMAVPAFLLLTAGTALVARRFWNLDPDKMMVAVQALSTQDFLPWLLVSIAATIMALAFGASWRRFLLLHEPPSAFDFRKPFRRYLLLVVIGYFTSSFIVTFLLQLMAAKPTAVILLLAGLVLLALTLLKHSLLFTAPLADAPALRWRDAGMLMRGNLGRYLAIWTLLFFSVSFINQVLGMVAGLAHVDAATLPGALVIGALNAVFVILLVATTSAAAALSYDFIVHGGGPPTLRDR